jgi:hypothetical protein
LILPTRTSSDDRQEDQSDGNRFHGLYLHWIPASNFCALETRNLYGRDRAVRSAGDRNRAVRACYAPMPIRTSDSARVTAHATGSTTVSEMLPRSAAA